MSKKTITPKRGDVVTREEQRHMGLLPETNNKFVPAIVDRPRQPVIPAHSRAETHLNVTPTATQHVESRTSATDTAVGFLISHTPMFLAYGLTVWLVAAYMGWAGLWTLAGMLYLWGTFAFSWVVSYAITLATSPGGIALFEVWRKWRYLETEQEHRWAHYDRLEGGE